MLLAYRLVKLIENHSDGLARSLHNRYRESEKCSAYANVPDSELTEKVYEVYRHLGDWLLGKTEADIEQRYLEVGAQRAAQGVPVSQVVWMICLVRENLWEYLQKHAELERPAEIFGELELLEMLDKFFHLAIYYAALGHERATAGYSVKTRNRTRLIEAVVYVVDRSIPQQTGDRARGRGLRGVGNASVHPSRLRRARGAGGSPDGARSLCQRC